MSKYKVETLLKTAKSQSMHLEHIGPIEEACELTALIEEIIVEVEQTKFCRKPKWLEKGCVSRETYEGHGKELKTKVKALQLECDGKDIILERLSQILKEANKVLEPEIKRNFGKNYEGE